MKFLLLLGIVVFAVLLWRSGRREQARASRPEQTASTGTPQEMVRCNHCDVHLPRSDALAGRLGFYCGPQHQQLAEP